MKKGIILVCMVTVLLTAGCGHSPSMVGKTYKHEMTLYNGSKLTTTLTFDTKTVSFSDNLSGQQAIVYPYSLTGDVVTIYPGEGTSGGESEDKKLADGGKMLTGPDGFVYHRQ